MAHTILIVDDDPTLVEMLTFVLQRGGYQTESAYDGSHAIEILRTRPVDLVVLDIMLPDTDGYEICRQIRSLPGIGQLPVLMLSARSQVAHRLTGFESGADDYVPKPADPKEILARVRALLGRAERAQAAPPPVIALVGAKGGVGTTTTAVNVALSILSSHRRVCLMEISRHGLSGAAQLGLHPTETVAELMAGQGAPSAWALQPGTLQHNSNLHYLAALPDELDGAELSADVAAQTAALLQSLYDAVIVDMGSGNCVEYADVLRRATAVVPVAEREPLSLGHLQTLLRWVERNRLDAKVPGIILVDHNVEPARDAASAIASQIGLGVLGVIPAAPLEMYQANLRCEPIALSAPDCDAAEALRDVAERLMGHPIEVPEGLRP